MITKVKKLVSVFLLVNCFIINLYSQGQGIRLNYTDTGLITILDEIEQLTGFYFLFNEKLIDTQQKITINTTGRGLDDILEMLFNRTNIKYTIVGNKIILAPEYLGFKDLQMPFSGEVTDENGNPLAGVNIHTEDNYAGTISDNRGRFTLTLSKIDTILIFSFIGYDQQKVHIEGKTSVKISMQPVVSNLEEVIVIGYGTVKKSDLTGAIVAVSQNEYETQPVARVDDILQGRSAGVNVTAVSGAPGGATTIRIRGPNSIIGGNEPLYVIDGFVGVDMGDINPTDIASIQILKDASSTAIYGSRGANGVVLITTKNGSANRSTITVTSRYYSGKPIKLWPLLSAGEFAQVCNERADAMGYARLYTDEEVADYYKNGGTDWQDLIFRTAIGEEVQLDFSGGNNNTTYFISGNYINQDGIIINSDFKRYSFRTNLKVKLSEKLNVTVKANFARRLSNNISGNFNTNGLVAGSTAWAPTTPAYDENGHLTTVDPISSVKTNPIELATNDAINESNTSSVIFNCIYQIARGLSLDIGLGADYNNTQRKTFVQRLRTNSPSASRTSDESIFLQNTNMLTYSRVFNNIHNITITGVAEYQVQRSDYFTASASDLLFPYLRYYNITLAKSYTLGNGYAKSTIGSYIGRINYSLFNKYLITASIRSDRSSKFRGKNQTSRFP